jgi:TetR/AcrR family transcriptional regulator
MPKSSAANKKIRRLPGRPAAGTLDQREALLDAAKLAFARHGFAGASLRSIAQDAHVTAALASYYFGDKAGLLAAVVDHRVAPLAHSLGAALMAAGEDPVVQLRAFVQAYTLTASRNPWLPQLIVREVLNEDGALRETFAPRFAGGMTAMLRQVIERAQRVGAIRDDLDPARAVMSLVSLCIFPFIATPLVSGALAIEVSENTAASLAAHHFSLFMTGVEDAR